MSTSAVTSSALTQQQYFQTRQGDLQQLGQALSSGDVAGAQTAFSKIVALGQSGPFNNGDPFAIAQREQDFTDIGHALQSGNLAGAQLAFTSLKNTFQRGEVPPSTVSAPNGAGTGSSSGPEIVLNLSSSSTTTPEQITININPTSGGGEQVALSVGQQGSSNPQQVTFNLAPNSNEEIVLNLLGTSSASGSASGTTNGLSVSA
jgi:hypothetical protein